ncbi:MlaD family protein [Nocardia sp. NPDC059177]|uniref:MlaD family protein n=1 Tax=Nocardia sp. NPDC059177 TaxID=3346759 RepID=UPI0036926EEA
MSRSIARLRSLLRRITAVDPANARTTDLRWGIVGLCAVVVLTVAVGVVSLVGTTAEREYAADLRQAGALRVGDDVRIAGITVGQVDTLTLRPDRVRMTFTVRDDVFLGDQTVLDIRMLTIVGGYYVAVQPAGSAPLGQAVIPMERVVLPYNLTQVFQDAVRPVEEIDGTVLRENLAAVSTSISGSPDAFRSAIGAAGDLVTVMNEQNADISKALSIADEYLTAIDASSDVLAQLIRMLRTLETIVQTHKATVAHALNTLSDVLHRASPLGRAWDASLHDRVGPLTDAVAGLDGLATHLGELSGALRALEDKLLPLLSGGAGARIDQSGVTVVPERLCIPVPGGGC